MVSGADPNNNEFSRGAHVKVSCRYELIDGELSDDGKGQWHFPRLQLRFVDSVAAPGPEISKVELDPEALVHYEI